MFNIMPRETVFFDLFEKSADNVQKGAQKLLELMSNFGDLAYRVQEIKEIEHTGDKLTHEMIERMNKTFITPLDREDIHSLASNLDDVLDAVEAIGSRIVLFKVGHPTAEAMRLATILTLCASQIEQAVDNLKNLQNLMAFTVEINRLENEADSISRTATADLFSGRHDLLDVLRWKEIYGRLEGASDMCEDVANAIESIVLKNR